MTLYEICLDRDDDVEDFLCQLTHVVWEALARLGQLENPHHYPLLEGHLREFIKPCLMMCDEKSCWKPYVRHFERREGAEGFRPVKDSGYSAYLEMRGTQREFAQDLTCWLFPRVRPILNELRDIQPASEAVQEAVVRSLARSVRKAVVGFGEGHPKKVGAPSKESSSCSPEMS